MPFKKTPFEKLARTSPDDRPFFSMFESHSAIMLLIEPLTGAILDANLSALEFYGYPKLIGMSITDINTLPAEQLAQDCQKALNNTQTYFVFRQRLSNDENRIVEVNFSPLTVQGRQVLFSITHDISRRDQIKTGLDKMARVLSDDEIIEYEQALENMNIYPIELEMQNHELRRSQLQLEAMKARYLDLYDLAPVGYCTLSPEGRILESNLVAAGMFGETRTFLDGKPFARFILKEYADIFYLCQKRLFASGLPQTCELQMLNKNYPAGLAWVFLEASLALDAQGAPEARIVIIDISERKQAEVEAVEREAARREQAVLAKADAERRLLLDNIQTQVWYMTDDHTYGIVNSAHAAFVGMSKESLVARSLYDFTQNDTVDGYIQDVKQVFASGQVIRTELRLPNAAGELRLLDIMTSPIMDVDGIVQQVVCSAEDITERKQAEDILNEKEQFIHSTLDALSVLLAILDENGIILSVNRAWRDFALVNDGEPTYQCEGVNYLALCDAAIGPDSSVAAAFAAGMRVVLQGKQDEFTLEYPCDAPHEKRWFTGKATRFTHNGAIHLVVAHENITERKQAEQALLQSEQRYRAVVEWAPYAIVVHRDGKIIYVNPAAMRMFGASSAQALLGNRIYDRIHPDSHKNVQARLKKSLEEGVSAPLAELQYLRLDGSIVDAEVQGIPILYDGAPAIYVVLADISARKQAEQALSYAHWQLESTIQGTHVGTWEWNVQTGETVFNEIWAQIIGYSQDELAPISIKTWERQVHPDNLILSSALLERHFAGELPYYDCELRMKHKDGHWVWVQDRGQVITRTVDGKPLLMFGTHTDISVRKAAEEKIRLLNIELENLALTDFLTNLFNRRYFMVRGAEAVKRVLRNQEPLALLMLDIDLFKQVNDNYGHEVGDLALQHVAGVLKSSLREIDILARIGGEEFAVLLPNTCQADAVDLAERVRKQVQETPFATEGESVIITISLGAAVFGKGMLDIDDLLRDADLALYDAKHSGRNCVRVFRDNLPPPPPGGGVGSLAEPKEAGQKLE